MKQDLRNNQNIKLGDVDLGMTDDQFNDPKNFKVRITTFIDSDIYEELRKRAGKGGKYQTLLNSLLRSSLFGEQSQAELFEAIEVANLALAVSNAKISGNQSKTITFNGKKIELGSRPIKEIIFDSIEHRAIHRATVPKKKTIKTKSEVEKRIRSTNKAASR